jgi:hypothetical protein
MKKAKDMTWITLSPLTLTPICLKYARFCCACAWPSKETVSMELVETKHEKHYLKQKRN